MGDDKPFCCTSPGCGMCFANEDHLTVHMKKHEMSLSFNTDNGSSKSNNLALFVDQTPTPTRFIRNCEEVGLFQDLQNVNPFEEHFRKAVEASKAGNPPIIEPMRNSMDTDILHTPSVLAADLEAVSRIVSEGVTTLDSPVPAVETVLNKGVMFCDTTTDDVDDDVSSVTPASSQVSTTINSGLSESVSFCGVSQDISILPTTESLTVVPERSTVPIQTVSSSTVTVVTQSAETPISSTIVTSPAAVVQLILKLPDGRSIPVSIPTLPFVGSVSDVSSTSSDISKAKTVPIVSTNVESSQLLAQTPVALTADSSDASSLTKLKLRQAITGNQLVVASPQISAGAECFGVVDAISNCTDSRDIFQAQKKRRSGEDDPDVKRKRFLERNRAAATRCRQKRKQWVQNLENKADELNSINQHLQNEVSMLRNEVAQLKSMLLAHKDCPVTQQQQKNRRQLNGVNTPTTFIIHKSGSAEIFQITPAEAIASSALTNLAQTTDSGTEPLILHCAQNEESVFVARNITSDTTSENANSKRPEDLVILNVSSASDYKTGAEQKQ